MSDRLQNLQKIVDTIAVIKARLDLHAANPPDALFLPDALLGSLVEGGRVVFYYPRSVTATEVRLLSKRFAAKASISAGAPVLLQNVDKELLPEEIRKQTWPAARRFYPYTVRAILPDTCPPQIPDDPPIEYPSISIDKVDISRDAAKALGTQKVQRIITLSANFADLSKAFVEQTLRLIAPPADVADELKHLVPLGPALVRDYLRVLRLQGKRPVSPPKSPSASMNIFIIAERLLQRLRDIAPELPKDSHIAELTKDAIRCLTVLLKLEGEMSEGKPLVKFQSNVCIGVNNSPPSPASQGRRDAEISQEEINKYETPKGTLPILKMPDPEFIMERLRARKEVGFLSRIRRDARVEAPQFLVSEAGATEDGHSYVYGVIAYKEPIEVKDMAALSEARLEGLDGLTREEFSVEPGPLYYMTFKLVSTFDPPLRLKAPVPSRRFGPEITLPEDVIKAVEPEVAPHYMCPVCGTGGLDMAASCPECHANSTFVSVPKAAETAMASDKPWLSFRGLSPAKLQTLSDEELRSLYILGADLVASTSLHVSGLSKEDLVNALTFILTEIRRRGLPYWPKVPVLQDMRKAGPTSTYAPIHRGSDSDLPEISANEVLTHFHEEFLLRSPVAYLVGSIANQGKTTNDIDILLKGPLDEDTAHILKFRLGRMLPADISRRVQFHGPEDSEKAIASGPFTAYYPLYDLLVRRREDFHTIVEMRDAIEKQARELPAEEAPTAGVLQLHLRGRSGHGDFRIKVNDYLVGFTLAIQKAGKIPKVDSVADAKHIASTFDKEGSSWNKALTAPSRVYCVPKAPEPLPWLRIEAEEFAPGSVGASRYERGYMVAIARPRVSFGETTPYFHEYFCEKDSKFSGLFAIRLLVSDKDADEEEIEAGRAAPKGEAFWTGTFTKSLLPSVLKPRAVSVGRIPPQGWAFLPPKLKASIPKRFRYWLPKDVRERREIRDALVEDGFLNESNVKLVDYEFQRVMVKYFVYKPDEKEENSWDSFIQKKDLSLFDVEAFGSFCAGAGINIHTLQSLEEAYRRYSERAPLAKRVGAQLWGSTAGKSHIAKQLVALFPEHKTYVEPFAGGAACFYAKEPSEKEVLNDLDKDIAAAFTFVRDASAKDIEAVKQKSWVGSRSQFKRLALSEPSSPIERFYKFAYMTRFAFMCNRHRITAVDPAAMGKTSKVPDRFEGAKERLEGVTIHCDDYRKIIAKYDAPDTFFFLDPPYAADSADAEVGESKFDTDAFFDVLKRIKGKYLVTYKGAIPKSYTGKLQRMTHHAYGGGNAGMKNYSTLLLSNYDVKGLKAPQAKADTAEFSLAWQRWKGQEVVRSAPSKQIFHLFIKRPDGVEDFRLFTDPLQALPVSGARFMLTAPEAQKLMAYEGPIEPKKKICGIVLNDTKATPSTMSQLFHGKIRFLEDSPTFKKFKLDSKRLPQLLVLRAEEDDKPEGVWILEAVASPGEKKHVAKEERIEDLTLADGTKLPDVQVWNPKDIKPTDDKTHDRERLQPIALYKPMKVAETRRNEFRFGEIDRLVEEFATQAMLKVGLAVEPKFNGFRVSMQKDAKGRMLLMTEDVFGRKTPLPNYLAGLPSLREEMQGLAGPFILDGEFMALDADGRPLPRRELAEYRSENPEEEDRVVINVFDILVHPTEGNVLIKPQSERKALLKRFIEHRGLRIFKYTPHKIVHTQKELVSALEWARHSPGSEGAMLKSLEATVTLRETDSMAKVKAAREIFGMVWERHEVKGSPGVYNFYYAIGPLTDSEAESWAETVDVEGKTYVKAGRTFNAKLDVAIGDVIRIEVTEILYDISDPKAKRIRGFTPTVVDRYDGKPSTVQEVLRNLDEGETKSTEGALKERVRKALGEHEWTLNVKKMNEEERYVLGVVLEPNVEYGDADTQGDAYDEAEVRKASEYFMEHARALGLMHETVLADTKICILENYLAPQDLKIDGNDIRKGTWLLAARIVDDTLWDAVKRGQLTGWSIEGSALAHMLRT